MDRRRFLSDLARGAGAALAFGAVSRSGAAQESAPAAGETREGDMIYRTLGRTGEKVSLIGLGGFHIGGIADEQQSIRLMRTAIDRGITFMDNCWDYHGGQSEIRMGKALKDGYRDRVFLMTKIDGQTREAATRQLEESLKRLQTDRIDLLQMHEVIRPEDPERIFAEGGAIEALKEAQKAGKVRYLGFTGHKDPQIHLRMLEVSKAHGVEFDAVQMPLNVMDAHFRSFEAHVLPVLTQRGIGVLGMKSMGNGDILRSGKVTPVECLHYAMSLPTSVVITGIDSMEILEQNLQAVRDFQPLTQTQVASLLERTADAAAEGQFELFKTSSRYDGTVHNPQWLGLEEG